MMIYMYMMNSASDCWTRNSLANIFMDILLVFFSSKITIKIIIVNIGGITFDGNTVSMVVFFYLMIIYELLVITLWFSQNQLSTMREFSRKRVSFFKMNRIFARMYFYEHSFFNFILPSIFICISNNILL